MSRYAEHGWLLVTPENYPSRQSAEFITLDDFLRLAFQAYVAARRELIPPVGESWLHTAGDPSAHPYADAEALHDGLLSQLSRRLTSHAVLTGHYAPPALIAEPSA